MPGSLKGVGIRFIGTLTAELTRFADAPQILNRGTFSDTLSNEGAPRQHSG